MAVMRVPQPTISSIKPSADGKITFTGDIGRPLQKNRSVQSFQHRPAELIRSETGLLVFVERNLTGDAREGIAGVLTNRLGSRQAENGDQRQHDRILNRGRSIIVLDELL